MTFRKLKLFAFSSLLLTGLLASSIPASAGHTILVHKNGTKTEISTSSFGTTVKKYSKNGMLVSTKKLSNVRGRSAHQNYVKSIRRRGDKRQ